jgi:hypothetical protein
MRTNEEIRQHSAERWARDHLTGLRRRLVPLNGPLRLTTENTGHHGERTEKNVPEHRDLTGRVIGIAIDVYRTIGRGLLESVCVEGKAWN